MIRYDSRIGRDGLDETVRRVEKLSSAENLADRCPRPGTVSRRPRSNHSGLQRRPQMTDADISPPGCHRALPSHWLVTRAMFEAVLAMAITAQAVYENGVLKPAEPLPLKEHERVSVTVEPARPPIWERLAARAAHTPPEEVIRLPPDGPRRSTTICMAIPGDGSNDRCRRGCFSPTPSTVALRALGVSEVLTNDHHFTQEGFTIVLPGP